MNELSTDAEAEMKRQAARFEQVARLRAAERARAVGDTVAEVRDVRAAAEALLPYGGPPPAPAAPSRRAQLGLVLLGAALAAFLPVVTTLGSGWLVALGLSLFTAASLLLVLG